MYVYLEWAPLLCTSARRCEQVCCTTSTLSWIKIYLSMYTWSEPHCSVHLLGGVNRCAVQLVHSAGSIYLSIYTWSEPHCSVHLLEGVDGCAVKLVLPARSGLHHTLATIKKNREYFNANLCDFPQIKRLFCSHNRFQTLGLKISDIQIQNIF